MNIGEKIKSIRSAKMMTQQELAGEHITRNMLSRIENGSALPSLPTLMYISARLGVPAGYLLADEDEDFHYHKLDRLPDIKRAYEAGDWLICRDLCESLGGTDDEIAHIVCLCLYNAAKEAFGAGDLRRATELFDSTRTRCSHTLYPVENIKAQCNAYLDCIYSISPSIAAEVDFEPGISFDALSEPFCRYWSLLDESDGQTALLIQETYVETADCPEKLYADHISARKSMSRGNHTEAYSTLKKILASNESIPAPMLYFIFCDLEECCRELSDYRGAYEYSSDKTGMLERFFR